MRKGLGGKFIVSKSYQATVRGGLSIQLGYKLFTLCYPKPNFSNPWISGYRKFQTLI